MADSLRARSLFTGAPRFRGAPYLALIPFAILYAAFFVVPLVSLSGYTSEGGLAVWLKPLQNRASMTILLRTLEIAAEVTVVTAGLGYAYVVTLLSVGRALRVVLIAALLVPLFANVLVLCYAWVVLLGPSGPVASLVSSLTGGATAPQLIYNRTGTLLGLMQYLLPLFTLTLYASVSRLPRDVFRAARSMGATGAQVFFSVLLPLSLPGAITGALLVFVTAVGFYIVPSMLGGTGDAMISQLIQQRLRVIDFAGAAVLSYYLLGGVLLVLLVANRFVNLQGLLIQRSARLRRQPRHSGRSSRFLDVAATRIMSAAGRVRWSLGAVAVAIGFSILSLAPIITLIPVSLVGDPVLRFPPTSWSTRWWSAVFDDPSWILSFGSSLLVGAVATTIALVVTIPLAWSLARHSWPGWLRGTVILVSIVPFVLPVTALAVVTYLWFLSQKMIGSLVALGAAHALLGVPFALAICLVGLTELDVSYERAARSLGASSWRAFRTIIVPLAAPTLAAAAFLAFFQSWSELVIALDVTNSTSTTLPVRMWIGSQQEISPALAVVSIVTMVVTLGAGVGALLLQQRRQARRRKALTRS